MLKQLGEKEEQISEVLGQLAEESSKGTLVLVEGKKDVEALRSLGLEGPISSVKTGGKSFLDIASEIQDHGTSKVVLLLDFDRRGKQGTNRLRRNLERTGVKVDMSAWLALLTLAGKDVPCIEGIPSYLEDLRGKIRPKLSR